MIRFTDAMDIRSRLVNKPTVAMFGDRYCVIGTQYGHIHTSSGDVKTWGSYSGARRAARLYVSF